MARGVAGGVGASKTKSIITVAHNCHGKTKNVTAKTKYIPHDKTKTLTAKYFTAKTKYLTAKANTRGKTKAILFLL